MEQQLISFWGLEQEKLDGMKVGMFSNSSYWGKKTNVLKSGVCKYTRRAMWDKLVWCVVEMVILGTKSKGIFTNLMNRLKILVMEELICLDIGEISELVTILESAESDFSIDLSSCLARLMEFCERLKGLKRGRVISYMNNWWKYEEEISVEGVELDKVKKYKKKGDTNELLGYGELFIEYLEEDSEKMFGIFQKLFGMEGKFGTRFRRKDAVYLLIEIIEDRLGGKNPKFDKVLEFGKTMFHRKQMTERRAFGVWMVMLAWKFKGMNSEVRTIKVFDDEDVANYMLARENIDINESFVVKDYHVDKSHGLAKFATEGAFVLDEDLSILGVNGRNYKRLYVDVKCGKPPIKRYTFVPKTKSLEKPKTSESIIEETNLEFIDWSKFTNVKVLEDGVCGLKVCCIRAGYEGRTYILKEMRQSFNYGRDYMLVDKLKSKFGIRDLEMKRIKSNMGLEQKDKTKKTFVGNWQFGERNVVYCMMVEFENLGDLGKNKEFLGEDSCFKESLKIRLYDGLFRSSDNILRNILVNSAGEVLSIDEGDLFGKRAKIFNSNDWFKKKENVEKTRSLATEIVKDWKLDDKVELVANEMDRWGFGSKVEEMRERFANYEKIVLEEL